MKNNNEVMIKEITQEINSITNCTECVKTDGCYTCRSRKPDLPIIKGMLQDLLEYKKSELKREGNK